MSFETYCLIDKGMNVDEAQALLNENFFRAILITGSPSDPICCVKGVGAPRGPWISLSFGKDQKIDHKKFIPASGPFSWIVKLLADSLAF